MTPRLPEPWQIEQLKRERENRQERPRLYIKPPPPARREREEEKPRGGGVITIQLW